MSNEDGLMMLVQETGWTFDYIIDLTWTQVNAMFKSLNKIKNAQNPDSNSDEHHSTHSPSTKSAIIRDPTIADKQKSDRIAESIRAHKKKMSKEGKPADMQTVLKLMLSK